MVISEEFKHKVINQLIRMGKSKLVFSPKNTMEWIYLQELAFGLGFGWRYGSDITVKTDYRPFVFLTAEDEVVHDDHFRRLKLTRSDTNASISRVSSIADLEYLHLALRNNYSDANYFDNQNNIAYFVHYLSDHPENFVIYEFDYNYNEWVLSLKEEIGSDWLATNPEVLIAHHQNFQPKNKIQEPYQIQTSFGESW